MLDPIDTNPSSTVNARELDRNAAPSLGDADAVEKTTYVGSAHSTEPAESAKSPPPVTAAVGSGRGLGALGWLALGAAVLALVAYAAALFR